MTFRRAAVLAGILLLPSLAQAHPNHGPATGLYGGLAHPLAGLDHLAAMLAVGLWAAQRGGRALWAIPLSFVGVMMFGAVLARGGMALPFVEQGIVVSVLILGILIAAAWSLPLAASMVLVGLFALFHGYAHGVEIPAMASGLAYGSGFVAATVSLLLLGVGLGLAAKRLSGEKMVRYAGAAVVACGLYLVSVT